MAKQVLVIRENEDTLGIITAIKTYLKAGVLNLLLCDLMNEIYTHKNEIKNTGMYEAKVKILPGMIRDSTENKNETTTEPAISKA